LAAASHAEALDHFRRTNAIYRRRLADGHRWQAEALGQTVGGAPEAEDAMGNLIVTGDVYGSDAAAIVAALQGNTPTPPAAVTPSSQSPPAAAQTPAASRGLASGLAKAALAAALIAGGGGLGTGLSYLLGAWRQGQSTNTTITRPADQTQLGIEVVPGGAQ
jgi:hypothetical protein